MRVLRWIGISLGVLVVLVGLGVATLSAVARRSEEPIGPFPAGPLTSGEWVAEAVDDWSFATDVGEVQLQLIDPEGTRITWIAVHDGKAYIPCGFPHFRLWKQWPHHAQADGRAIVRIDGRRYPVQLVRETDADAYAAVNRLVSEKYGVGSGDVPDPELVWVFRLDSREAASG